jgi:hypothetical protein
VKKTPLDLTVWIRRRYRLSGGPPPGAYVRADELAVLLRWLAADLRNAGHHGGPAVLEALADDLGSVST